MLFRSSRSFKAVLLPPPLIPVTITNLMRISPLSLLDLVYLFFITLIPKSFLESESEFAEEDDLRFQSDIELFIYTLRHKLHQISDIAARRMILVDDEATVF